MPVRAFIDSDIGYLLIGTLFMVPVLMPVRAFIDSDRDYFLAWVEVAKS